MAPIQFGVVLVPFQLTDVTGPLDVLSSSSVEFLRMFSEMNKWDASLPDRGIDIEFHYIGETMEPVTSTANCKIQPTVTCDACPKLDYLLVGGPKPEYILNIPPIMASFIRDKVEEVTTVFATCTGPMILGMLGLLDGLNATVNHQVVPWARHMRPQVNWTDEKQWVIDGKWWTAGGACAGMDMFAHWVKKNYSQDIAEIGWAGLDYEPRDVDGQLVPRKFGLRVQGVNGVQAAH